MSLSALTVRGGGHCEVQQAGIERLSTSKDSIHFVQWCSSNTSAHSQGRTHCDLFVAKGEVTAVLVGEYVYHSENRLMILFMPLRIQKNNRFMLKDCKHLKRRMQAVSSIMYMCKHSRMHTQTTAQQRHHSQTARRQSWPSCGAARCLSRDSSAAGGVGGVQSGVKKNKETKCKAESRALGLFPLSHRLANHY